MMHRGSVMALAGDASDAVQTLALGVKAWRATGATVWLPLFLSYSAMAYAALNQFDDAWRCLEEAIKFGDV